MVYHIFEKIEMFIHNVKKKNKINKQGTSRQLKKKRSKLAVYMNGDIPIASSKFIH